MFCQVLILATGFRVQDYFSPLRVIGHKNVDLMEQWRSEGPRSYYGIISSVIQNGFFLDEEQSESESRNDINGN